MEAERSIKASQNEELTPALLTRVLWKSFEFSKGAPDVQSAIFSYVRNKRQHWRIDKELFGSVDLNLLRSGLEKKIATGQHVSARRRDGAEISSELMLQEFERALKDLRKEFDRTFGGRMSEYLASGLIHGDAKYVFDPVTGDAPQLERSSLVRYGMRAESTGVAVYDEMFEDLVAYLREQAGRVSPQIFTEDQQSLRALLDLQQQSGVPTHRELDFPRLPTRVIRHIGSVTSSVRTALWSALKDGV